MRLSFIKEKDRHIKLFSLLTFIALAVAFSTKTITIQAAVTGNPIIPKGAISIDGLFAPANIQNKSGGAGGDTGISPGPSDQNNGVPFSEIHLSGSQNAVSIFSDDRYKMDFSKSFKGRAYVNFGTAQADGFAFVMHNDDRKTSALTTALAAADGQNLGVYGGSASVGAFWNVTTPETYAIKNSVDVEFDLYANNSGDTMYDTDYPNVPHMAYSFPGDLSKGYSPIGSYGWNGVLGTGDKAKVHHYSPQTLNGVVGDNVQDGTWYEFRYDFDHSTNTFTYYLQNPVTGAKTATVSIPWADLSSALKLSDNNNKAYWGFTAANGDNNGQVKFVFTQVPVDLDASVKNDVLDREESVVNTSDSPTYQPTVPSAFHGDPITLKSHFTVQQGEAPLAMDEWDTSIDPAVFDLSKSITDVKAVIGNTTVAGSVQSNSDAQTGDYKITFPGLKVSPGQSVDLQFTAQTKASGDIKKSVFSNVLHMTEQGSNAPETYPSNPAYFWIRTESPTKLAWDQSSTDTIKTLSLDKSDLTQDLQGKFLWSDSDQNENLQFYLKKGDETIQKLPQVTTKGTGDYQTANFTIPKDKLAYGENDFTVEAYRLDYNSKEIKEKATLTFKVTVGGKLVFQSAPDILKWTGRLSGDSKGILSRDNGNTMHLSVFDSREKDHNWSVGVTAESQAGTPFNLVWRNKNSGGSQDINDTPLPVMNDSSVPINNYVYSEDWSEAQGILLQSKEYLHVGDYSGKIVVHWNLYDTESPE